MCPHQHANRETCKTCSWNLVPSSNKFAGLFVHCFTHLFPCKLRVQDCDVKHDGCLPNETETCKQAFIFLSVSHANVHCSMQCQADRLTNWKHTEDGCLAIKSSHPDSLTPQKGVYWVLLVDCPFGEQCIHLPKHLSVQPT